MKLTLILLPLLVGCPPTPPQPPPGPDADASGPPVPAQDSGDMDASTPPTPTDDCGKAELTLQKLACKDPRGRLLGGPNMHGVAWAQVCRDNKLNGVDMKPGCIAVASTCAAVESCK